ncbi:TPA: hypothetical protein NK990_003905 [Vibrio parahaemolyticus]|nr:hypothetical protein [Vibrio parahaemolyticus]
MQKLLNVVVWLLIGVCVATMTYNVLEKERLNTSIESIQTTQNTVLEQQRDILKLLD